MKRKPTKSNLSSDLKRLSQIAEWFDTQKDLDVEEGLQKVKEAAALIKACKERLREVENEFVEIKKDIEKEIIDEVTEEDEDKEEDFEPPF